MLENWEFFLPTRIRFGWGLAGQLGQSLAQWGRRVFWVGYRNGAGLEGVYEKLRGRLQEAGLLVEEFFEVSEEPDVGLVNRAAEAARSFGADLVLGVGGGSVLDTAKAVAGLARMGGRLEQYLPGQPAPCRMTDALPIVAVPTTAGTGSEVTALAVFHWQDPAGGQMPMKLTLAAEALAPKLALVDPELTVSCPPAISARGAADALGHAIEAALSRRASPMVRFLAEEAMIRIFRYLPAVLARPEDRQAREALALAATLAGIALQQAGATLAHAMAHALGALAGLPHSEAVAICTPAALRYNWAEARPVLARWASRLGLPGQEEQALAEAFLAHLERLFHQADLPTRPRLPTPATEVDWPTRLAQNAFQTTSVAIKLNPRKIDPLTLASLFQQLCR